MMALDTAMNCPQTYIVERYMYLQNYT